MRRAPDSFNPYLSVTPEGEMIAARLFPTLFREEPELEDGLPKLTPETVEIVAWSEDGLAVALTLRDGLRWSDGAPLTAEDVVYTLEIRRDPQVGWISSPDESPVASFEARGAGEVFVRFRHRSPFNLIQLNEGVILPKRHFSQWPTAEWKTRDWLEGLVVFGPYRVAEYAAGERLRLAPLQNGAPAAALAFVRDREALFQLLAAGELDYAFGLPVERLDEIQSKLRPVVFNDLSFSFIAWNPVRADAFADAAPAAREGLETLKRDSAHALFGDPRVRRAMTLAMDRAGYIRRFWRDLTEVPSTPWRAGLDYPPGELKPRVQDLDAAGRLLDQAGWKRDGEWRRKDGQPFRFTLICNAGSDFRERYLLAVRADLKRLGVDMRIEMQEAGRFMGNMAGRQFDALFGVFRAGTRPDLSMLFHGDAALGGYNIASWTRADDALARVRAADSVEALQTALAEAERLFYEDQPMTLLYQGLSLGAAAGLDPSANYLDPLFDIERWRRAQ